MYYIYILRCIDNSLYTGITTDIERRLKEHLKELKNGAKYTANHKPVKVEQLWSCENRSLASKFEYRFKKLTKAQKETFILHPNEKMIISLEWENYHFEEIPEKNNNSQNKKN